MTHLALALLLVFTNAKPAGLESLAPLAKWVALASELMDKREEKYLLAKPDEFMADIDLIRRRANDLREAPYLAASEKFPDRTIINELLMFNRAYKKHLEASLELYPRNAALREAKEETELLYQVWDLARDGNCSYYYVHIRRMALLKLRGMIGAEDFAMGKLPPHIPSWRFYVIR